MYTIKRTGVSKFVLLLTVLLIIISCLIIKLPQRSYAVLPENYLNASSSGLNWEEGENYLNISAVKALVDSFKKNSDYDFDKLAADPVVIAVVDTGVEYRHELFQGKYDETGAPVDTDGIGGYDVFLRDENGRVICYDATSDSDHLHSVLDLTPNKHGTHVTGIIAKLIHALDLEKYVKIMPVRISKGNNGNLNDEYIERGILYASGHGADVINLSLGSYSSAVWDYVGAVADKTVFVAAAGNGNNQGGAGYDAATGSILKPKIMYPAALDNVVGVMSYNYNPKGGGKYIAYESNYGNCYDICSPGANILSADGDTTDGYKTLNGTSMASPVIAAAAAVAIMKYEALGIDTYPAEIRAMISKHSVNYINKKTYNFPVLDLKSLLEGNYYDVPGFLPPPDAEQLEITVVGNKTQVLCHEEELKFIAEIFPERAANGSEIIWSVKTPENIAGSDLGRGREFLYTPDSGAGNYTVTARISGTDLKLSKSVTVVYKVITPSTAEIINETDQSVGDDLEIGQKTTFSLKDIESSDPNTTHVTWYVNGVSYSSGGTFDFVPQKAGKYEIQVAINNRFVPSSYVVNVKGGAEAPEPFDLKAIIIGATVGGAAAIALLIAVLIISERHKKKRAKNK